MKKQVKTKNFNILRTKGAFRRKLKAFFIFFKGLSLKQIKQFCLEGEGRTLIKIVISTKYLRIIICSLKVGVCRRNIEHTNLPYIMR